jgi:iron complex transport system substrate-binding protein
VKGVVSLLPAATEIVCALGLRGALRGRSHECDWPEGVDALPVLTRARLDARAPSGDIDRQVRDLVARGEPLYLLDEDALAAADPEVVVTQEACDVCAIAFPQVARSVRRVAPRAAIVSLAPARLHDILGDVRTVAAACGVPARGEAVADEMAARLRSVAAAAPRLRVAVVEWLDPPMLAGHWMPDAVAAAGGIPLGPAPGARSTTVSWDDLAALRPDALVVAPCGFDLDRTRAEAVPWRHRLRALAPRVLLVDGNAYFNRPAPRIVDATLALARWLRGANPCDARLLSLGASTS